MTHFWNPVPLCLDGVVSDLDHKWFRIVPFPATQMALYCIIRNTMHLHDKAQVSFFQKYKCS